MAAFILLQAPSLRLDFVYGVGHAWGVWGENTLKKRGGSLSHPSDLAKLKIHFKGSPQPLFYCTLVLDMVKI